MYKILFTDIDGTLTDSKGHIPKENERAVKKLLNKGIKVVLCTGRNITGALPVAKKLNITEPIICIDGILLCDIKHKKPLCDLKMEKKEAEAVIGVAKKHNVFAEVSNGYLYYKYIPKKEHRKFDFGNGHTVFDYIKGYFKGLRYLKSYESLKNVSGNLYQVTIACGEDKFDVISEEIKALGFDDIAVRDMLWKNYIFVNKKGADKARGIEILCRKYGISPKEAVAIGDDMNDLKMLEYCGMGVAIKNSPEEVLKSADYITDTDDNCGFAKACKKFFDLD